MPPPATRKSLEPWIPDSLQYYWWQVEGIRQGLRYKNFILGDEMGLGKSLVTLSIFAVDVKLGRASKCLIVAPVTLKGNWQEEIEKFTRFPYVLLDGTPLERKLQLEEYRRVPTPSILVINYEQVKAHLEELNQIYFDVAIWDEAHYVRNHTAARTKAFHRHRSARNYLITGTPLMNQVNELWSLLYKCNPTETGKYYPFVNRHAVFGGYKGKSIIGVKNKAELKEKLHRYMIRRLAIDTLSLAEPQIISRLVSLHPEQEKLYNEVVEDMKLTLPNNPTPHDIQNGLTKFLRLKQICGTTGTMLGADQDFSSKLDLAIQDDQELINQGEKLVVFTQFLGVQECYVQRAKKQIRYNGKPVPIFQLNGAVKPKDRVPVKNSWERVDGPSIIVCMLQVSAEGLNMQVAHHGSFLDKLFVPFRNSQAIGRLNRIGQKHPVQIREYRVRNTIENRIEQILRTKKDIFDSVVEKGDYKHILYKLLKEATDEKAA